MPGTRSNLLILALMLTVVANAWAQRPEPEIHGHFEGEPMYTVLPPDAIPAIRAPDFVSGDEAREQMFADESVIGLMVDGCPRAYSLWQLDSHEIVNDRGFAVTW